mmetsp:Transcript_8986/g.10773  ORF Transcript_8986/g.10773 Transcript_8986/m.10773 type:complete len:782 (-) Transcript_8986:128-2473(-)
MASINEDAYESIQTGKLSLKGGLDLGSKLKKDKKKKKKKKKPKYEDSDTDGDMLSDTYESEMETEIESEGAADEHEDVHEKRSKKSRSKSLFDDHDENPSETENETDTDYLDSKLEEEDDRDRARGDRAESRDQSEKDEDEAGFESDLGGFEAETLDAISEVEDNDENEKPAESRKPRRSSVGQKALNLLSSKLGFGKKKGNATDTEDEEEAWWRSLEENTGRSRRKKHRKSKSKRRTPRRKRKLAVRPEYAAKVEYVTDEESEYLQDFRRRRSRTPLVQTPVPPPSLHSHNSVPNMFSVPANNVSSTPSSAASLPSGASYMSGPAEAEKEEQELEQARSGLYTPPNHPSRQPVHYHYHNQPPQSPFQLYEDRAYSPTNMYPAVVPTSPYYIDSYFSDGALYDYDSRVEADRRRERKSRRYKRAKMKERKRKEKRKKRKEIEKRKDLKRKEAQVELQLKKLKNRREFFDIKSDEETDNRDTDLELDFDAEGESDYDAGIESEVDFVDLSKIDDHSEYEDQTDEEDTMVADRDVRARSKPAKPMRYEKRLSNNYYSDDDGSKVVIQYGEGDKHSRRDRKPKQYRVPFAKSDMRYDSDSELYSLRNQLSRAGASKYFPMMAKAGIKTLDSRALSKIDKLPIKSAKEKSRLRQKISKISKSRNILARSYESDTSASGFDSAPDDVVVGSDKRKGVLINKKSREERSRGRTSPSRHVYEPESEPESRKSESVRKEKKSSTKSVTFDIAEDDEYSLPSADEDNDSLAELSDSSSSGVDSDSDSDSD